MDLSAFSFERVCEDGEFIVFRGELEGNMSSILLVAPTSDHRLPPALSGMHQAYALRDELDPAWAARPLDLADYRGLQALVLQNPGGDSLGRLIGGPLDTKQFLRAAIGIASYSGVGKSSVVNELHKALVPSRGFFASGKFDQTKRDIPYATLAQAFQQLARQILGQSERELRQWRTAILQALGPN